MFLQGIYFFRYTAPLGSCQEIQRLKGRLGDPVDAQGANEGWTEGWPRDE